MMELPGTVVVLTDGELNLAHFLDLLRGRGVRVLATSRPYEVMAFLARHQPDALLLRAALIPEAPDSFLRQIRGMGPRPFLILTAETEVPSPVQELADLTLTEPFRYSALEEALRYGRARRAGSGVVRASPEAGAEDPALYRRLLAGARRLSELEREGEGLHAAALEAFLDLLACEEGGVYTFAGDPPHPTLVRASSGFAEIDARLRGSLGAMGLLTVPRVLADSASGQGLALALPVGDQRQLLAAVVVARRRGGEPLRESDAERVHPLVQHYAITLGNAQRWEDVQRLAVIDPLTGLYNRRFFERQIAVELERARRYDRQLTLALLDIDSFKVINDLNGYAAGDSLIRAAAEIIRKSFREVDVVTRWGGDEFAVLLPETAKPRLPLPGEPPFLNYVERVRRAVEATDFRTFIPEFHGRVTISAGVATFPADGRDRESLFLRANQALRRAKRTGHNRVCVAGEDGQSGTGIPVA
jgi:diguanylate cyclase (GGDEF)-like protein